jgi:3-dehydroquinate dehydratase
VHTSIAIRYPFLGVDIPFIEIHITNTHARRKFRRQNYLPDKAEAVIEGLGTFGQIAGIEYKVRDVKSRRERDGVDQVISEKRMANCWVEIIRRRVQSV